MSCDDLALKYGLEDDYAYKRAYLQTHPDKGGNVDEFLALRDCQKSKFYKKNKSFSMQKPPLKTQEPSLTRKYSAPDYYSTPVRGKYNRMAHSSAYDNYKPLSIRVAPYYFTRPRPDINDVFERFYELRPEAMPISQKRLKSKLKLKQKTRKRSYQQSERKRTNRFKRSKGRSKRR